MKKVLCMLLFAMILCVGLCSCGDEDYSSDDYDYDKGYGYSAPEKGEKFSDYVKRQDPDLYDDMQDIWEGLN